MTDEPLASIGRINVDQHKVDVFLNALGVSAMAGACAAVVSTNMRTFWGFVRCTLLAFFVGYVIGSICDAYGIKDGMTHGLVGLGGFLANYILAFMVQLAQLASANPMVIVNWLLSWIPGRKPKE